MRFRAWLLVVTICAPALVAQPQRATVEQWRADIDYLASELPKRHPNPFTITPRETFLASLNSLKADVPQLSDIDIVQRMQMAVASLGDAHTSVNTNVYSLTYFPLIVYPFSDGFFVTRTTADARLACGAKLVAVDGVPIEEVLRRFSTLISHENDQWVLARTNVMLRAENLFTKHARFTFERQGAQFEMDLQAISATAANELFARPPELTRNYWYEWDEARGLLYVKYNVCAEDPLKPMTAFVNEIMQIVDSGRVTTFVVDVRNNAGGNSAVIQPMIDAIARRQVLRNRVFGLIGRETFSSGLFAAIDLKNRDFARLVGEPTGGKPNAFGDILSFTLRATGISVTYSTKRFTLMPGDPPYLEPDLFVPLSSTDYFAHRDPVLESIVPPPATPAIEQVPSKRRAVSPFQPRRCD